MLETFRAWAVSKLLPIGMAAGIAPGGSVVPPKRGTAALLEAYNEMPWLRAVVNKVGRIVGATTWTLQAPTRSGSNGGRAVRRSSLARAAGTERRRALAALRKQGTLRDIEEHPLLDLLGHGNDHLPGAVVMQVLQQHLDLVGEGYLVKVRGGLNQPTDLWPIPPSWTRGTPFLTENGQGFKFQYRGWSLDATPEDVVWLIDPDMSNPYGRGSGAARALADELETDELAAKHISAFFYNNARPDMLVSLKQGGREEAQRLEAKWLEKLQGVYNRRRPVFTGSEIDVKEIGQTFQEMQLVPLRQYERDTIIQVYGFPPEVFGILSSSNRATIESAGYLLAKYVIEPRLEMLRTYLQEYLVPDFDDRLILDFVSPVEEDKEHKRSVYTASPWAFTVDEHRALGGEDEKPNGQGRVHALPFTLFFDQLSSAGAPTEPEPTEPEPTEPEPVESEPPDDDGDSEPTQRVRRRALTRQFGESELSILLSTLDDGRVRRSVWGISAAKAAEIVEEFGARALEEIGASIEFQATARVAEFQRSWATDRSRLIDPVTKSKLKGVLSQAIVDGSSSQEMVKGIRGVYEEATRSRAFMIARTETTRASNFAVTEGFRQAGVERKSWLATRDTHVRDSHLALDGQVVDANASFVIPEGANAGATAQYPGDFGIAEEDISCRCATTAVFQDEEGRDITSLDTEEKRAKAWRAFEGHRVAAERGFRPVIRASFRKQQDILLEEFRKLSERGGLE